MSLWSHNVSRNYNPSQQFKLSRNPRRNLFEGKSAVEAYGCAGYKPCRQSAHKLLTRADVQARLAELQEEAAKQCAVTVESLMAELEHARQHADSLGQLSASVRAICAKMQLAGLAIDRKEIEVNATIDVYAEATTREEVLVKLAEDCGIEAAVALAAAFKFGLDEPAILAMCNAPRSTSNGERVIEWKPPRKQVRREP
jgi:hypothetical protein